MQKLEIGDIIIADSSWMLHEIRYAQISVGQNTTTCPITGDITPVYNSPEYMHDLPVNKNTGGPSDREHNIFMRDNLKAYAERIGLRLRGKYFVVEDSKPTIHHGEYVFALECDASGVPLEKALRASFYHGTSGHHLNIACPKVVGHSEAVSSKLQLAS